jgi:single-strand DNA-binding protein
MEALVHITGYAGTEVEVRGQGTVSSFRLACTPRVRVKGGEYGDGNTTWIEVSCFRGLAEHVAASIRKGDPVLVIGRLRTSVWEKNGQTFDRLGIEADTVGHDLSKGTSMFRRKPRVSGADAAGVTEPPDDVAEAGPNAEERAAQAA